MYTHKKSTGRQKIKFLMIVLLLIRRHSVFRHLSQLMRLWYLSHMRAFAVRTYEIWK